MIDINIGKPMDCQYHESNTGSYECCFSRESHPWSHNFLCIFINPDVNYSKYQRAVTVHIKHIRGFLEELKQFETEGRREYSFEPEGCEYWDYTVTECPICDEPVETKGTFVSFPKFDELPHKNNMHDYTCIHRSCISELIERIEGEMQEVGNETDIFRDEL